VNGGYVVQPILFYGVAMELSDNARKLLKHFQSNDFAHGEYQYPATMLYVFDGNAEACEKAQQELSELGLLDLGSAAQQYHANRVRSAALSLKGDRYLEESLCK
jgi:hypothetical protein